MARTAFLTRAYNAAPFLSEAVESVLHQTDGDFVYFLCDNGSTDGTGSLVRSFAARDPRIVPIAWEKNSPLESMNLLLQRVYESGCEYFAVLDADDAYEPEFLRTGIARLEETGADLFLCGSRFFSQDGPRGQRALPESVTIDRAEFGAWFPPLHTHLRAYWAKLFRLSVLLHPPLFVDNSLFYGSDTVFLLDAFARCRRLTGTPELLHRYRLHGSSDSHRLLPGRFEDDKRQHARTVGILRENGWLTDENRLFLARVFLNACADTAFLAMHQKELSTRAAVLGEIFSSPELHAAWERLLREAPQAPEHDRIRATAQASFVSLRAPLVPGPGEEPPPDEDALRAALVLRDAAPYCESRLHHAEALLLLSVYARRAGDDRVSRLAARELAESGDLPDKEGLF